MAIIKLTGYTGEMPRVAARLLPDTGAQIARSTRMEDGKLAPFRKPLAVHDLAGATPGLVNTIYKHLGDWLYWETVVHAVPGPVADDRLYYTGDGVPKMLVGSTVYALALPAPTAALTSARVGALGAVTSTVLYVRTFVTSLGEESEPSPISADLEVSPGNTVTLSGFTLPPAGRAIVNERIYRSQTGTSGGTQLYFIAERACSIVDYSDTLALNDFSEPLPSTDWNPPPDDLHNLIELPNGMMAAISGKELCFCEPYRPHAWPEKYRLAMSYDGVALGAYSNTVVVGTTGWPYLAGGTHPDSMVMEKIETSLPCLSSQGMVDLGYAVVYPSHDGLVMIQGGSATVPSTELFTRDQWLAMDPATMVCGQFYGRFYGAYDYTDTKGVHQIGTIIMDLTGSSPFILRSPHHADAFYYELATGKLHMAIGATVYEWDSPLAVNDIMTYRSKQFVTAAPTSFGAILVELDGADNADQVIAYQAALAANAASNAALFAGSLGGGINDAPLNTYCVNGDALLATPDGPILSVNVYADGKLLAAVNGTGDMQRLPGGILSRQWEIEVSGNVAALDIAMAGTAQELRSVP